MPFIFRPAPRAPEQIAKWIEEQLRALEQHLVEPSEANFMKLRELHNEPAKPRDGMVVLADGTDWNPGSGAGFYGRYGGSWVKLG